MSEQNECNNNKKSHILYVVWMSFWTMIFFCSPTHHVVRIVKQYSVHIECVYCHPLVTFPNTDVHNLTLTTYCMLLGAFLFLWLHKDGGRWQWGSHFTVHHRWKGVEEGFTEYTAVTDTLQRHIQPGMVNHVHKRPTHSYGFNDDSFASSAVWQILFVFSLSLSPICELWWLIWNFRVSAQEQPRMQDLWSMAEHVEMEVVVQCEWR